MAKLRSSKSSLWVRVLLPLCLFMRWLKDACLIAVRSFFDSVTRLSQLFGDFFIFLNSIVFLFYFFYKKIYNWIIREDFDDNSDKIEEAPVVEFKRVINTPEGPKEIIFVRLKREDEMSEEEKQKEQKRQRKLRARWLKKHYFWKKVSQNSDYLVSLQSETYILIDKI